MKLEDLLSAPTFIINLDRSKERLERTTERIRKEGFTNVQRFAATDGTDTAQLNETWRQVFGKDAKSIAMHPDLRNYPGAQGCLLSHMRLWRSIVDQRLPLVNIFEDDIYFHPQFATLAAKCCAETPREFHLLYLGCIFFIRSTSFVVCEPAYTTSSYTITLAGAHRLLALFTARERYHQLHTCDGVLITTPLLSLIWYNWNLPEDHDTNRWNDLCNATDGLPRIYGLVKQDLYSFPSLIR